MRENILKQYRTLLDLMHAAYPNEPMVAMITLPADGGAESATVLTPHQVNEDHLNELIDSINAELATHVGMKERKNYDS